MARLFTYADGRLRTGRVSLLIFAGLLGAMCLLFKAGRSVDHAVLAVKHVFEPAAVEPGQQRFEIDPKKVQKKKQAPQAAVEMAAANMQETRKWDSRAAEPAAPQAGPQGKTEGIKADPPTNAMAEKGEESKPVEFPEPEKQTAPQGTPKAEPAAPDPQENLPEVQEIENAYAAGEAATRADETGPQQEKAETSRTPVFDQKGLQKLARLGEEASPQKEGPGAEKLDVPEQLKRLSSNSEAPAPKSQSSRSPAADPVRKKAPVQADREKGEVTVDPTQYMTLFKSWQASGKGGKGKENIPLRVQDLRRAYDLFQMKVIAVVNGDVFLDLTDGSRVADASLSEYSTTLFRVDRPWDKWGEALAAAGVRRSEQVEVRYYMYDFVKEAIYARVHAAFSWCKENGLIAGNVSPAAVDVLGRAYVINRQGGGRFGVFVPVSLDTRDGHTVAIDPACFHGQADVEALHGAGLL